MTTTRVVQVVTTADTPEAAQRLASAAVRARAAACAQVDGPIKSTYRWQGAVEAAEEWRITFKTTATAYAALEAFLKDHHPYDVPEILCIPVTAGNSAYLAGRPGDISELIRIEMCPARDPHITAAR